MVKSRRNVILALIMILVMSMSMLLVACGEGSESNNDNKNPSSFTVTFLKPGVEQPWVEHETVTSKEGVIAAPTNPTMPHFAFVGWYKEKEFTNKVEDVTTLKASTTLYAKFDKVDFEVTFIANGYIQVKQSDGNSLTKLPADPVAPVGKVFAGWFVDEACTKAFENGNITSDMTVYAKFNDINTTYPDCDVTIKVEGKDDVVVKSHYGAVELPANPVKENWAFMGWYTDEAFENVFVNGAIQENITLYAKFQQVNFTIKFMQMGADNNWAEIETKVSTANKIEAPAIPDKKGYKFEGWFTDKNFRNVFDANNVTKDVTAYAKIVKLPGKNVTFMAPNVGAEGWYEYDIVESDSATDKVTLPGNVFIQYAEFLGWYTTETFETEFTGEENITEAITVYAKTRNIKVNVQFDANKKADQNLFDIKSDFGFKAGEGKVLDGWYKDSTFNIKWNGKDDVTELFARTAIGVIFNNGYEDLYVGKVQDNEVFQDPSKQMVEVDGVMKTLESIMIKDYMSDRDISYVDDQGNAFDFSAPITKETKVTVVWNTKLSDSVYKLNPKTGNYYIETYSFPSAPVVSILSYATIMVPESEAEGAPLVPRKVNVEAIYSYGSGLINENIKKIMIGEGIVSIKGLTGEATCIVDTVVLPKSLKVIDGCFNNMPKLKSVNIPEGVEVVLASFFKKSMQDYKTNYLGTPYDFDIAIPASVKNMAHVPNNFTFAPESTFSKEGGYIYQTTAKGKVLISDPAAYTNFDETGNAYADTIIVPEGVEGIQVGTYNVWFNYLKLPSTFKFVNYNANASDYPAYVGMEGSAYSFSSIMLFDETALEAPSAMMSPQAYTIATCLGGARVGMNPDWTAIFGYGGKVVFATEAVPADLNGFAFAGDSTGYAVMNGAYQKMDDAALKDSVILKDAVNKVYVTSTYNNLGKAELVLTDAKLDAKAVKDAVIAKFPANLQSEIAASKDIKFYSDNKEVALGDVTSDMFVTMVIVPPAKLFVNTSWQIGYTGSGFSADDYTKPAEATKFHKGDFQMVKIDLTGMTVDSLKAEMKAQALKEAMNDWYVENFATEVNAKAYLDYFYSHATVEFQVDGKNVDLSTLTLENGSINLDVVWTLA